MSCSLLSILLPGKGSLAGLAAGALAIDSLKPGIKYWWRKHVRTTAWKMTSGG